MIQTFINMFSCCFSCTFCNRSNDVLDEFYKEMNTYTESSVHQKHPI
jgi:hypothetical protein